MTTTIESPRAAAPTHSESGPPAPHHAASHDDHDEIGSIPAAPRASRWVMFSLSGAAIVIGGGLFLLGWIPRVLQSTELAGHVAERRATPGPRGHTQAGPRDGHRRGAW